MAIVLDVLVARNWKDRQLARRRLVRRRLARSQSRRAALTRIMEWQEQGENAALPLNAGELDLATEQQRQLAADCEAEAGATVFAGGAGIRLLEGLDDESLLFRRDT